MEINRLHSGAISAPQTTPSLPHRKTGGDEANETDGRNFASVWEKVAQPEPAPKRQEPRDKQQPENQSQTPTTARSKEQQSQDDTDDQPQQAAPSGAAWSTLATVNEPMDAQTILPKQDLEAMLAAVRTQLLPGGERELTMALPHSILQGLRVQLHTTPTGRITANFLTESKEIKAVLDTRTHELTELLRARGVNLVAVKTSLDAAPQQQNQSQQQPSPFPRTTETSDVVAVTARSEAGEIHLEISTPDSTADLWRA